MFGLRRTSAITFAGAAALMTGLAVMAPTVAAAAPVVAPVTAPAPTDTASRGLIASD